MIRYFPADHKRIKIMKEETAIITNDPAGRSKNGLNYGAYDVFLTDEQIEALNNHKCIAINLSDEYVVLLNKDYGRQNT